MYYYDYSTFSGSYWIDNIRCGGQEHELSECRFDSWGENDCDPSEAAGVMCDSSNAKKPKTDTPKIAKKVQKHRIKVCIYLFSL